MSFPAIPLVSAAGLVMLDCDCASCHKICNVFDAMVENPPTQEDEVVQMIRLATDATTRETAILLRTFAVEPV